MLYLTTPRQLCLDLGAPREDWGVECLSHRGVTAIRGSEGEGKESMLYKDQRKNLGM